jgi:Na+-translocating ferredoxin:NAD+ oxidoreductase RNF subunit RnfB
MVFASMAIFAVVGLVIGAALVITSQKLYRRLDERADTVQRALPGINCGACGEPSCAAFAESAIQGRVPVTQCIPGGPKTANRVAEILGQSLGEDEGPEQLTAVVRCKGGTREAKERFIYDGIADCRAATMVGNGAKTCADGCLGLGSCVRACPYDALTIDANGVAVVNQDRCNGCGLCVPACPRGVIELIPRIHKIFVGCNNHDAGVRVLQYCTVGCTACSVCVAATPSGAISMQNNLPRLDYTRGDNFIPAAHKCPWKCFVDLAQARPKVNITPTCTGCGECVLICPVDAIAGLDGQRHVVDKAKCIGCGICITACPVHAISLLGGLGYRSHSRPTIRRVK